MFKFCSLVAGTKYKLSIQIYHAINFILLKGLGLIPKISIKTNQ
jgi:hypothetical protein